MIMYLEPNQIFVFGSNIQGIHGGGAARHARQWGAVQGLSKGRMGQTYGIETKDLFKNEFLGWEYVEEQLLELIEYAKSLPEFDFLLTPVGTGLAGGKIEDLNKIMEHLNLPDNIKKSWNNENT
jgi:hypothetical protein